MNSVQQYNFERQESAVTALLMSAKDTLNRNADKQVKKQVSKEKLNSAAVCSPVQVGISLALAVIEGNLESLIENLPEEASSNKREESRFDVDVYSAVEVSLSETKRMKERKYGNIDDFFEDLWLVNGVVRCAFQTFSDRGTYCSRLFNDLLSNIKTFHEMIEIAELGRK